jgi:cytochrome P450 family 142 subfamily A polypeptide 1
VSDRLVRHPKNPSVRLLDGHFYARDPHPHFTWLREHAPVYWDDTGSVWGVTRHADVMAVSKRSDLFCNRLSTRPDAPPVPSMINLDDPLHKKRRNLVNKGFTPKRVAALEPHVRRICSELVERARARGRFDFVHDVAAPLPMIMIGDLLGVEPKDRDMLLRWSDAMILATSSTATQEHLIGASQAFAEFAAYNQRVVADRRSRKLSDDLMGVLVHAEIDGERLDDEALLHDALLILVGGDETTRHVISGGTYELLRDAEQWSRLVESPELIPQAVEEMLRWVTPIQNMCRTATEDVELGGQPIRQGDKLLLLYPSANRDEAVFDRPFDFDITRDPNDHVAFGGYGAHFCLGSSLARLELRVMFEELAARMPELALASDAPPPRRPSNFITGIESMPVVLRGA